MRYTAVFKLNDSLADAVAVEWTDRDTPQGSGAGWHACVKLPNGDWRFASHSIAPEDQAQWREPGLFPNIALRYRLSASGPWSPISPDRKEITITAAGVEELVPPALTTNAWSTFAPHDLGEGVFTGSFALYGAPEAAVAVEWTTAADPAEDGDVWKACVELGAGRWRLGGAGDAHVLREGGELEGIGLRYRLSADTPWSPVSQGRRSVRIPFTVPVPVLPVLLLAPTLAGAGKIGDEITVTPGLWTGTPTPELRLQWCRDGADIPGATGTSYRPGPEDDLASVSCRVCAANPAGEVEAVTAPLAITYIAPQVIGEIFEEIFDQGTGPQTVETAAAFEGEALTFSVAGANAQIDATTGVVSIPTDQPVDGETVTVSAMNSGGSVESDFQVTVEEAVVKLLALEAEDWEPIVVEEAASPPDGAAQLTCAIRILNANHPAWDAVDLRRTASSDVETKIPPQGLEPCIRHPDFADPDSPFYRVWLWRTAGGTKNRHQAQPDITIKTTLWYALEAKGPYSPPSNTRSWVQYDPRPESRPAPKPEPQPQPEISTYRILGERTVEEAEQDIYPGGDLQYWHSSTWCVGNPDVLYGIQDVAGVWTSRDAAQSWMACRNKGLHAVHGISIQVDPVDPDLVICTVNARQNADKKPYVGAYRSTDGGGTWNRIIAVGALGEVRTHNRSIAYDPGSISRGRAQIWYVALSPTADSSGESRIDHGLWRGTDAGTAFTRIGDLSSSTFGDDILALLVNPDNDRQLFVTSTDGFFRLNLAADYRSFTITQLDGKNGLPGGGYTTLEVDKDNGGDITVCKPGDGIWRTTTGATGSWSRIYAWGDIFQHAVGRANRNRMNAISTKANGNSNQPRWTENALGRSPAWSQIGSANIVERPGAGSGANPPRDRIGVNGQNTIMVHPANSNIIWAMGSNGFMYRSTDKGATFRHASAGYTGMGVAARDTLWHPTDPLKWALPVNDVGLWFTEDGGMGYRRVNPNPGPAGGGKQITSSVAYCPQDPRIMLCAAGDKYSSMPVHRSVQAGAAGTWKTVISTDDRHQYIGWHRQKAGIVYCGQRKSTDYGASWSTMDMPKDARVIAIAPTDGDVVYAVNNGGSGNSNTLYRSTNGGSRWSVVASGWSFGAQSNSPGCPIEVHPDDPNIVFAKGPGEILSKYVVGGGRTDYDSIWESGIPRHDNGVKQIGVDPRRTEVIYLMFRRAGEPQIARTTDGGATWEDISYDVPLADPKGISVNPFTGDLLTTSQQGSRVLPPPYKQTNPPTLHSRRAAYGNNVWMGRST